MQDGGGESVTAGGELYRSLGPESRPRRIKAVPYYAWANRGEGEMTVWIRESR